MFLECSIRTYLFRRPCNRPSHARSALQPYAARVLQPGKWRLMELLMQCSPRTLLYIQTSASQQDVAEEGSYNVLPQAMSVHASPQDTTHANAQSSRYNPRPWTLIYHAVNTSANSSQLSHTQHCLWTPLTNIYESS